MRPLHLRVALVTCAALAPGALGEVGGANEAEGRLGDLAHQDGIDSGNSGIGSAMQGLYQDIDGQFNSQEMGSVKHHGLKCQSYKNCEPMNAGSNNVTTDVYTEYQTNTENTLFAATLDMAGASQDTNDTALVANAPLAHASKTLTVNSTQIVLPDGYTYTAPTVQLIIQTIDTLGGYINCTVTQCQFANVTVQSGSTANILTLSDGLAYTIALTNASTATTGQITLRPGTTYSLKMSNVFLSVSLPLGGLAPVYMCDGSIKVVNNSAMVAGPTGIISLSASGYVYSPSASVFIYSGNVISGVRYSSVTTAVWSVANSYTTFTGLTTLTNNKTGGNLRSLAFTGVGNVLQGTKLTLPNVAVPYVGAYDFTVAGVMTLSIPAQHITVTGYSGISAGVYDLSVFSMQLAPSCTLLSEISGTTVTLTQMLAFMDDVGLVTFTGGTSPIVLTSAASGGKVELSSYTYSGTSLTSSMDVSVMGPIVGKLTPHYATSSTVYDFEIIGYAGVLATADVYAVDALQYQTQGVIPTISKTSNSYAAIISGNDGSVAVQAGSSVTYGTCSLTSGSGGTMTPTTYTVLGTPNFGMQFSDSISTGTASLVNGSTVNWASCTAVVSPTSSSVTFTAFNTTKTVVFNTGATISGNGTVAVNANFWYYITGVPTAFLQVGHSCSYIVADGSLLVLPGGVVITIGQQSTVSSQTYTTISPSTTISPAGSIIDGYNSGNLYVDSNFTFQNFNYLNTGVYNPVTINPGYPYSSYTTGYQLTNYIAAEANASVADYGDGSFSLSGVVVTNQAATQNDITLPIGNFLIQVSGIILLPAGTYMVHVNELPFSLHATNGTIWYCDGSIVMAPGSYLVSKANPSLPGFAVGPNGGTINGSTGETYMFSQCSFYYMTAYTVQYGIWYGSGVYQLNGVFSGTFENGTASIDTTFGSTAASDSNGNIALPSNCIWYVQNTAIHLSSSTSCGQLSASAQKIILPSTTSVAVNSSYPALSFTTSSGDTGSLDTSGLVTFAVSATLVVTVQPTASLTYTLSAISGGGATWGYTGTFSIAASGRVDVSGASAISASTTLGASGTASSVVFGGNVSLIGTSLTFSQPNGNSAGTLVPDATNSVLNIADGAFLNGGSCTNAQILGGLTASASGSLTFNSSVYGLYIPVNYINIAVAVSFGSTLVHTGSCYVTVPSSGTMTSTTPFGKVFSIAVGTGSQLYLDGSNTIYGLSTFNLESPLDSYTVSTTGTVNWAIDTGVVTNTSTADLVTMQSGVPLTTYSAVANSTLNVYGTVSVTGSAVAQIDPTGHWIVNLLVNSYSPAGYSNVPIQATTLRARLESMSASVVLSGTSYTLSDVVMYSNVYGYSNSSIYVASGTISISTPTISLPAGGSYSATVANSPYTLSTSASGGLYWLSDGTSLLPSSTSVNTPQDSIVLNAGGVLDASQNAILLNVNQTISAAVLQAANGYAWWRPNGAFLFVYDTALQFSTGTGNTLLTFTCTTVCTSSAASLPLPNAAHVSLPSGSLSWGGGPAVPFSATFLALSSTGSTVGTLSLSMASIGLSSTRVAQSTSFVYSTLTQLRAGSINRSTNGNTEKLVSHSAAAAIEYNSNVTTHAVKAAIETGFVLSTTGGTMSVSGIVTVGSAAIVYYPSNITYDYEPTDGTGGAQWAPSGAFATSGHVSLSLRAATGVSALTVYPTGSALIQVDSGVVGVAKICSSYIYGTSPSLTATYTGCGILTPSTISSLTIPASASVIGGVCSTIVFNTGGTISATNGVTFNSGSTFAMQKGMRSFVANLNDNSTLQYATTCAANLGPLGQFSVCDSQPACQNILITAPGAQGSKKTIVLHNV